MTKMVISCKRCRHILTRLTHEAVFTPAPTVRGFLVGGHVDSDEGRRRGRPASSPGREYTNTAAEALVARGHQTL